MVFCLSSIGPLDLVSNSAVGANYGYQLIWALVVVVLARYFVLEASARYVLATGESLLAGYGRVGRWVVWLIFVMILARRHIAAMYQILLLGFCGHLLAPLPTSWSRPIWSLVFWTIGFALMFWGRYRLVERLSKPLLVLLGGSLVAAALLSQPDLAAAARGALIPSVPTGQGVYSYALLLMALAGASAGSFSNLKYAAFVHEKGWRDDSYFRHQRADLLLAVGSMLAMSALMQIAAAATLKPHGVQLERPEDLIPVFSQAMGEAAPIVLGVGLWGAVFTTYLGSVTGNALIVTDIYHRFIRPVDDVTSLDREGATTSSRSSYRWFLVWFCASPIYVLLTDWKPIFLTLLTASIFVVVLPVLIAVLLKLTNDRNLMKEHVNGWHTNVALVFLAVIALCLTYQNALELWPKLTGAE